MQKLESTSQLLHHDTEADIRQLLRYVLIDPTTPKVDKRSIAISIKSVTRPNGQEQDQARFGVYFAPGSLLNFSAVIPSKESESGQLADLYTLQQALEKLHKSCEDMMGVSRVVIITDSEEVVEGLSSSVWDWEYNGYKTAEGKSVVDGTIFKKLHGTISKLENDGIDVSFWLVEEEWNQDAKRLATQS